MAGLKVRGRARSKELLPLGVGRGAKIPTYQPNPDASKVLRETKQTNQLNKSRLFLTSVLTIQLIHKADAPVWFSCDRVYYRLTDKGLLRTVFRAHTQLQACWLNHTCEPGGICQKGQEGRGQGSL